MFDNTEGVCWKLIEDANFYGIARSICVESNQKNIRIGDVKLKCFFDNDGIIKKHYTQLNSTHN